jgi:hypothetical protein
MCVVAAMVMPSACSSKKSTIEIVDFGPEGPAGHYQEEFNEAVFDIDARGHLDIVLRRQEPSPTPAGNDLTQMVHLHGIWHSIPGQTVADQTQINSCVTYAVMDGELGSSFDGTGALFLNGKLREDSLEGTLERAVLKPRRNLAAHRPLFEKADLSGRFFANRDRQRTRQLVNDLHRRFGSVPSSAP